MANGQPVREYGGTATITHHVLEDAEAFAKVAERLRRHMLKALAESGAPLNVWRIGQLSGYLSSPIDHRTGNPQEWNCQNCGYVTPAHTPTCPDYASTT
jgi:lipopolysaccharide biosynthesis regulator YciM